MATTNKGKSYANQSDTLGKKESSAGKEKAERSQCEKAKKVTRRPEGEERRKGVASK